MWSVILNWIWWLFNETGEEGKVKASQVYLKINDSIHYASFFVSWLLYSPYEISETLKIVISFLKGKRSVLDCLILLKIQVSWLLAKKQTKKKQSCLNLFEFSATFHIETRQLTCAANQMTGFYMKYNTSLKRASIFFMYLALKLRLRDVPNIHDCVSLQK